MGGDYRRRWAQNRILFLLLLTMKLPARESWLPYIRESLCMRFTLAESAVIVVLGAVVVIFG